MYIVGVDDLLHTQNESKYDIYLSYNKADLDFARKLARKAERQHIKGRFLKVFFDEWDIEPGENILLKIEQAESSSRFVVLVMSPEWLQSNWTTLERVIPAYDDPAGLKGRIIPIMRRRCEPPPSIRILKWLDFTADSSFEREFGKLISRIRGQTLRELFGHERETAQLPSTPHEATTADGQEEELVSNLFPTTQLPFYVNVANARVKKRADVWGILGEGVDLPPFAIDEGKCKIYSFADLKNVQYRFGELCLQPSTESIPTESILAEKDSTIVIELLNRSMTRHMQTIGMIYDWKSKKTFFQLQNPEGSARYARWRIGKKEYVRFLVRKSPTKNPFYVHRSCKATFTLVDRWPYLKIQPGWHFTQDGMGVPVSASRMSSLSSRWMNRQRNHSILDDVRFWLYVLSKGSGRLNVFVGGNVSAVVSTVPVFANVNRGIEGDYRERLWHERPGSDYLERIIEKVPTFEEA